MFEFEYHINNYNLDDTGMFGKADPYARLIIGVQEYSTRPNPAGGKNPIWNEEFVFDISNERYVRGAMTVQYVG